MKIMTVRVNDERPLSFYHLQSYQNDQRDNELIWKMYSISSKAKYTSRKVLTFLEEREVAL